MLSDGIVVFYTHLVIRAISLANLEFPVVGGYTTKSIELALLVLRILGIAKHLSKIKPTLNLILCSICSGTSPIHRQKQKASVSLSFGLKFWRTLICGQTTNAFFAFFDFSRVETWVQNYEKIFIFANKS